MLRFLGNVWVGSNQFLFDFMAAVDLLGEPELIIIRNWLADPFWP